MGENLPDHLIRQRIYAVLSDLYELMEDEIKSPIYNLLNVEDSVIVRR